jgi:hypothetical protein
MPQICPARSATHRKVRSVPPPLESTIAQFFPHPDLVDAFAINCPPGTLPDINTLAETMFMNSPQWLKFLMDLRDRIMTSFGVKTAQEMQNRLDQNAQDHINFFRVYSRSDNEIVMGNDDTHLDFKVSLLLRMNGTNLLPQRL